MTHYDIHVLFLLQAQLPQVPSQPVEQFTAEDLPEVPTQEPAGMYQICTPYQSTTVENLQQPWMCIFGHLHPVPYTCSSHLM